jgi:hypothetical protein
MDSDVLHKCAMTGRHKMQTALFSASVSTVMARPVILRASGATGQTSARSATHLRRFAAVLVGLLSIPSW